MFFLFIYLQGASSSSINKVFKNHDKQTSIYKANKWLKADLLALPMLLLRSDLFSVDFDMN